jgi:hypothetical protein
MKALFLRKKSVPSQVECVLNRSISERFPFFWERFFFLKIGHSLFWNAFFTVLFDYYFSLGCPESFMSFERIWTEIGF